MTRVNEKVPYTKDYLDALKSDHWRKLKDGLIRDMDGCCEACGAFSHDLQLHHKHYRTIGRETWRDVELLCPWCHKEADDERIQARQSQRAKAINTYAMKRWGRGWDRIISFQDAADEFDAWLTWKKKRSKR